MVAHMAPKNLLDKEGPKYVLYMKLAHQQAMYVESSKKWKHNTFNYIYHLNTVTYMYIDIEKQITTDLEI